MTKQFDFERTTITDIEEILEIQTNFGKGQSYSIQGQKTSVAVIGKIVTDYGKKEPEYTIKLNIL